MRESRRILLLAARAPPFSDDRLRRLERCFYKGPAMKFVKWILRSFLRPGRYKQIQLLWQTGQLQAKMNDFESARVSFLQLLDYRDELEAAGLLGLALMCLDGVWLPLERYDEMIEFFSSYIARFPHDAQGYFSRAGAFWYSDRLERAIEDYSRALELTSTLTLARSGRGQVLAEMSKYQQAMDDFDVALPELKKHQDSATPEWAQFYRECEAFLHRGRGVALAGLGLFERAMEEFEESVSMQPANAWVYYSRAKIHEAQGNRDKALNDYQTALAKDNPSLTPIQRQRAQARLRELT